MKENIVGRKIMETASRLFYEQGYHATGINQIIEESDVARASFYKYYPSKHDLLLGYIETRETEWFETVRSYMGQYEDPKDKILSLFDFRLDSQLRSNFTGCAFNRICSEIEKDDEKSFELLKRQKESFRKIMRTLAAQLPEGTCRHLSADELGDTIFMMLEGATNIGTVSKDAEAVRSAKRLAEVLLKN